MGNFNNSIDALGHDVVLDSLIDRSITEFKDEYLTIIGDSAFATCSNLKEVDLLKVTKIGIMAFMSCTALDTLILRGTPQMDTLGRVNGVGASFASGTAIEKGNGYIYVPGEYMSAYQNGTYAKDFANQYRVLENYTVDGTIMGELDPNKI